MEQPKDYETINNDDVVIEFTHEEIVHLRIFTAVAFILGVLIGALVF
jgi:hypothetical protein